MEGKFQRAKSVGVCMYCGEPYKRGELIYEEWVGCSHEKCYDKRKKIMDTQHGKPEVLGKWKEWNLAFDCDAASLKINKYQRIDIRCAGKLRKPLFGIQVNGWWVNGSIKFTGVEPAKRHAEEILRESAQEVLEYL